MVRSMFSGVSGLRSHQTRMDTIGNNIANVNTYGFKSGRTTFRDIYYQSMRSASEPTAAVGGVNPSSVGYGSQVGSVDLMMGRSTFSMTDQTMDIAIDGDGFLQVQDAAGNIYYTRAGMLGFDAAGNLVDMQGNFVLGVNGDPTGKAPGSDKIQVVLPPVPPTPASVVQSVNGLEFTISAQKPTTDGNLNFNFATNPNLADGEVVASLSSTGIVVSMHPDNAYKSLQELNDAINSAITKANGDQEHPAGRFEVSYTGPAGDNPFLAENLPRPEGYKASEIVSVDYSIQMGKVNFTTPNTIFGGVYPSGKVGNTFGEKFTSDNPEVTSFTCTYDPGMNEFRFEMVIDGETYDGVVDSTKSASGRFQLKNNGSETDYIELVRPSFGGIYDAYMAGDTTGAPAEFTYTGIPNAATMRAGDSFTFGNPQQTYTVPNTYPGTVNYDTVMKNLAKAITNGTSYDAEWSGSDMVLTARKDGVQTSTDAPIVNYKSAPALVTTVNNQGDGSNPADFDFAMPAAADLKAGSKITFGTPQQTFTVPTGYLPADYATVMGNLATAIGAAFPDYTVSAAGGTINMLANANGAKTTPVINYDGRDASALGITQSAPGVDPQGKFDPLAGTDLTNNNTNPVATASGPSNALGFSSTSFALRGGTEGGPQTVADMTEIYIAPNGIITGKDAQGLPVTIGRIDVATFANAAGLNQSGASNYTESSNSGDPQLTQPGLNGAGKLVSGTLELSNVDLSREFSDMITTQRGYQANSRIITVSDTMLEELINLKR